MRVLARIQTGRVSAPILLVLALLVLGGLFATLPKSSGDAAPSLGGPDGSDSARVAALLKDFPDADRTAALVVYARGPAAGRAGDALPARDRLTATQQAVVAQRAADLAARSTTPQAVRPQLSDDGTAALVVVPLASTDDTAALTTAADRLRTTASRDLPGGLHVWVTGPVGFQADTIGAFAGADLRLLLITAGVVALLLLVVYRSPLLWLVPLVVVAAADGLARFVVSAIAQATGIAVDASILGILSVLVFGAGTDYALLLIARYREELLARADAREAMRVAVASAGPAILASGLTVILSLLTLLVATLAGDRALGIACAVGIAIALIMAVVVLPAALVVCGRGLFWPFVPRVREGAAPTAAEEHRVWSRVGGVVRRRPVVVGVLALVLIGALTAGLAGARVGLSQTEQLLGDPESVQGERILEDAFPGGGGATTTVLARTVTAEAAATLAEGVDGVASARPSAAHDGWTRIDVTLTGAPESDAAFASVRDLRSAYSGASGTDASELRRSLVGGTDASALDRDDAAARDRALVIPLILAVVLLVLVVLLRSLVAPLVLIVSVVATFAASLGAGNLLFRTLLGFPAFDTSVLLYSFLFLVALGVDYNIFIATRAREERARLGARDGMLEALTRTGGVITSAGVLLAAVFVVLGVLPVVALAQIGAIVCIGVLLDTLVVRTLLVPAVAFLLGERFWWPARRPVHHRHVAGEEPAG